MEKKALYMGVDSSILAIYGGYYFEKYPRRKKPPIPSAIPPSLNRFIGMKRMQQNNLKQKYKEFAVWLADYYGASNLQLTKVTMKIQFYFKDKRRRDFDNMVLTPKFFNDGFVEAGVFTDDSGDILRIDFENFKYDKENPRVEITLIY